MDSPLISIIIPTKNGGTFLPRAVASIDAQSEKNVEIIIVSDGSTDDTVSVAEDLAKTRSYLKVIVLEKNVGPGVARDAGIKQGRGIYITLLDDDDEWIDAEKLRIQKEFLERNQDYVLVGCKETDLMRDNSSHRLTRQNETSSEKIHEHFLLVNAFITSSVMFRKSDYVRAGGFSSMYLAEDYDLWLRLGKLGKVTNLAGCRTRYYMRNSGASKKNKIKMSIAMGKMLPRYKNNYPHYHKALFKNYMRIAVSLLLK
jgi:glycosyltransferase involved in cell wall biosynthesis